MAEFIGTDDGDIIVGGGGNDTIVGGRGADTLTGGGGVDLFVVDHAESSAVGALGDPDGKIDVITDWSSDDHLLFQHALEPDADTLLAATAIDYDAAYQLSQEAFADGYEYVSVKVGADVFVFAPRTDTVVRLLGASTDDVTSGTLSDFITEGDERHLSITTDYFRAGDGGDTVYGMAGTDTLIGGAGADQIFAGEDNDSINGGEGRNYLRGDEGDDVILGGAQHDDINGNTGRDVIDAGDGNDWIHGGKDDDIIFAGNGDDLVFGDMGADTAGGGAGDDVMHGGELEDTLRGDDGNDTLFGDAGRDTLDGGNGADLFMAQANSGDDRVLAFSAGEGDRVHVDAGTSYSVFQEDDDTIIQMDGSKMVLVGVQLSTLPDGWIVS